MRISDAWAGVQGDVLALLKLLAAPGAFRRPVMVVGHLLGLEAEGKGRVVDGRHQKGLGDFEFVFF